MEGCQCTGRLQALAGQLEEEPPRLGVQVSILGACPRPGPLQCTCPLPHCLGSCPDSLQRASSLVVLHRLWTDEDNYNLIKDHYAWFLDTYQSLPKPVMKADSARYLYMYHIGGLPPLCQMPTCCRLKSVRVAMSIIFSQARSMVFEGIAVEPA